MAFSAQKQLRLTGVHPPHFPGMAKANALGAADVRTALAMKGGPAGRSISAEESSESDHMGFLLEGEEEDASVHALVEVASENLQLKRRLHEMSTELVSLQALVRRCHMHREMEQDHQEVEKHKFEWKSRYWNDVEHERFLQAIQLHGHRNFKAIAAHVGSRTPTQVSAFG